MMALWLFLLAQSSSPAPEDVLTRVVYSISVRDGVDTFSADLVLNYLNKDAFSIRCRKIPAGGLFTYWAEPDQDTLYFSKERLGFQGQGRPFALFPGGPELDRSGWLKLLQDPEMGMIGDYHVGRDDDWHVIEDVARNFVIRWRESKRVYKLRYPRRLLTPNVPADVPMVPLSDFSKYWVHHKGEQE